MSDLLDRLSFEEYKQLTKANVDVVNRAIQAMGEGDAEAVVALLSEDLTFRMNGSTPFSRTLAGRDDFVSLFGDVGAKLQGMIQLEVDNLIAAGDWVVTEARGKATTKDGEPYNNSYCLLWRIEDGKIARLVEYNDTQLIMDVLFKE